MLYRLLFRHVLTRIDAERAHELAVRGLRPLGGLPLPLPRPRDPRLRVHALGRTFPSPLGVAAGLDKDAAWFEALGALGFGFVEVGTVTARPQAGNPRPRIWRIPAARALLNSMGFPNAGAAAVAARLGARRGRTVVGVNVGKSRDVALDAAAEDHRRALHDVAPHADYVVLNVSSPNTPGLRDMQDVARLDALLEAVRAELDSLGRRLPVLVKIAPDLDDGQVDAIADFARTRGVEGIVAVNTTVRRDPVVFRDVDPATPGGVSGAPLADRAIEVLERLHARAGDGVVLVSVGGIETAADVVARVRAGATLVQAFTGFVYGGPLWPSRINRGVARAVRAAGAASIQDLVGAG